MASLIEHLGMGPIHVVGASLGGAIGQYMALDHSHTVRTLTLLGSFALVDPFEELAHAISGCQFVVVPECGHMVDFEKASEFFGIVDAFIGRHLSAATHMVA